MGWLENTKTGWKRRIFSINGKPGLPKEAVLTRTLSWLTRSPFSFTITSSRTTATPYRWNKWSSSSHNDFQFFQRYSSTMSTITTWSTSFTHSPSSHAKTSHSTSFTSSPKTTNGPTATLTATIGERHIVTISAMGVICALSGIALAMLWWWWLYDWKWWNDY